MSFRRYEDDRDLQGGGRWDRSRFERARAKSRPRERESFRFEEDDRYGPRGHTREIDIDDRLRSPRGGRLEERDRFFEDDGYRGGRRFDFEEEDRYRGGKELAPYMNRFEPEPPPPKPGIIRRRSSWDAFDRRPYQEPRYEGRDRERENDRIKLNIRMGSPHADEDRAKSPREDLADKKSRYSGFDDRRSHYDDHRSNHDDRERRIDIDERNGDRRLKIDIDERNHDEPRHRREEPRYYREPQHDYRDGGYEDYNGARIIRERERIIDRRANSPPRETREIEPVREPVREPSREREHDVEEHQYRYDEKTKEKRPPGAKRGKTRMPKRLVHKQALIDLGYPFEEEGDFYLVLYALEKEKIDETIRFSEGFWESERVTYSYEREKEEPKAIEAPPPPPAEAAQGGEQEFEETVVRKVIENPTEEDYERFRADGEYEKIEGEGRHESDNERSVAKSRTRSKSRKRSKSHRRRSKSRHRSRHNSDYYRSEKVEYSSDDDSKGRMDVVLPERRKKDRGDRDIDHEIKRLDRERRHLKHERERDERRPMGRRLERHHDSTSSDSDDGGSVRIEKDRRALRRSGRSKSRRRSKSKGVTQRQLDVAAATLT